MIDKSGYRHNVGIVLVNHQNQVFWGRRIGRMGGWQFPQGGIHENETAVQAMFREMFEEMGLKEKDVEIIAVSKQWLTYHLPKKYLRPHIKPLCIGQKQKWFLLRLISNESQICLTAGPKPEFARWRWVEFWHPLEEIIDFKLDVYKALLEEFAEVLSINSS